jgi:hypothetical protein
MDYPGMPSPDADPRFPQRAETGAIRHTDRKMLNLRRVQSINKIAGRFAYHGNIEARSIQVPGKPQNMLLPTTHTRIINDEEHLQFPVNGQSLPR